MEASFDYSKTLSNVLHFLPYDAINKEHRKGPKGYLVKRYVASAEIVDLENDIIDLQALANVMPIMLKQGGRIQGGHTNFPSGEFFDWGFMKYEGEDAIWIDVEHYDDYPTQKEYLRRVLLPMEDNDSFNCISLGGFKLAKKRECDYNRCWTRVTELEGWEFSHVHKGANILAVDIENDIENMEFSSLLKEQPRNSKGQFSPVSSITTTTKYDNSLLHKADCKCKDSVGKVYDKEDDEHPEVEEEEIEAMEEDEDKEEAEPNGDPSEEGLMEEPKQDEASMLNELVQGNRALLAALNIEKGKLKNDDAKKGKTKMEPPTEIEYKGQKYSLIKEEIDKSDKTDEVKDEIKEDKTEKTEFDPIKFEQKFDEKINKLAETLTNQFMELKKETPEKVVVSDEDIQPSQDDEIEKGDLKFEGTPEDRLRILNDNALKMHNYVQGR